jgi:signal transduction histidine kinase
MAARPPRSLLWNYAATVAGMVSVLLLAAGAAAGWQMTALASHAAQQLQQAEARAAAAEMAGLVARAQTALRSSAAKFAGPGAPDLAELQIELAGLLRHQPLAAVCWMAASGRQRVAMARVGSGEAACFGPDTQGTPPERGAVSTSGWVGSVQFRKGSEPFVQLAAAATPEAGLLAAELNLRLARDLVGRSNGETAYVVDGEGQLIAHADHAQVLARTDVSRLAHVRRAMAGLPAGDGARDLSGTAVIASSAPVGALPWTVIVEQPRARALAPVWQALWPALALLGAGLLAALAASLVLARRMVQPIRAIEQQARLLAQGQASAPVRPAGGAELQSLARQFNQMASRLQDTLAQQEQRIAERTAELASANAAKTRFLAAASHDLRQPIHALGLFAGQLRAAALPGEVGALAGRVDDLAQHLSRLLDALLDLSQLDAGGVRTQPQDIPLHPLLQQLAQRMAGVADAQGLALRALPTRLWGHTDPLLLERILQNLLANALRYTPQGRVLLGCRPRGAMVELLVADTGCGIDAAQLPLVFDEFWRGGATPGNGGDGGVGLGLAIVQRLARLLGHGLEIQSEPGRGTVVRLLLPRAEPQALPLAATPAVVDRLQGRKVLVVDDDAPARNALHGLLARWGCDVRSADGATTALAAAAGCEMVLCDLELASAGEAGTLRDGVDLVQALQAASRPPPRCAFVSGTCSEALLAKARASGLPVAGKPVSPAQLRALLEHLADTPAPGPG